jgi:hypothetical protein
MKNRISKIMLGVAAVAAMALGGSAIASAVTQSPTGSTGQAESQSQAGDQTAADNQGGQDQSEASDRSEANDKSEQSGKDTDNIQDENGKDDATETGNEQVDSDGPGGHADETAGANGGSAGK